MSVEPVAVIADPHYHDTRAGTAFRTLADTAESTRVFNESFAALPRLLDDIAARGIRLVALLGDLTDDGQAATTQAATALLHAYRERHGLRFFATPGNHDLFAIHGRHQSKRFLNPDGSHTLLTSDPAAPQGDSVAKLVDPGMYCGGYADALAAMADFGFFRRPDHLHWESPFGPDDALAARSFEIRSADGGTRRRIIDASYLVEPVEGLWLLAIDANVFEPRDGGGDPAAEASWIDSTDAGWNAMPRLKPFILDWMADVAAPRPRRRQAAPRLLALPGPRHPRQRPRRRARPLRRDRPHPPRARRRHRPRRRVDRHRRPLQRPPARQRDQPLARRETASSSTSPSPRSSPSRPATRSPPSQAGTCRVRTIALDDVPGHDAAFAAYRAEIAREGRALAALTAGVEPRRLPQPPRRRPRRPPLPAPRMARRHRRAGAALDLAELARRAGVAPDGAHALPHPGRGLVSPAQGPRPRAPLHPARSASPPGAPSPPPAPRATGPRAASTPGSPASCG